MMTTEQTFNCVFCKEVFNEKEALQIHFRKHGDPVFNFNQSVKNRSKSRKDVASDKTSDENENVKCDVCDEVFITISKAITHKHKAHPDYDAKYFCPFCGKLFTMKHLYNKHKQSNHEHEESFDIKDFRCNCCEVDFYVPSAMVYHNKFFHRQDTELPAIGHSKKVKMYYQEMIQIYYCPFCGEEYNNKVNLHKHIFDDHEDENKSPSEILRCPLCDAIFYHLDAYEVHLMFHSSEDLYNERSEMAEQITEFSLEAVAPIMEKVEEETVNTDGVDNFLQLVMDEAGDEPDRVKSKKHKKHKKSKKAAITLDEFLNMNKDVFGDGLDVQGIEEVPTQVVLKKVKGKKLLTKGQSKAVNADIAKLKKQGITIKTKPGNQSNEVNKDNTDYNQLNKTKSIGNHNELLSKLFKKGNSEIRIVKKRVPQNLNTETDNVSGENKSSQDCKGHNLYEAEDAQTSSSNNINGSNENVCRDQISSNKTQDNIERDSNDSKNQKEFEETSTKCVSQAVQDTYTEEINKSNTTLTDNKRLLPSNETDMEISDKLLPDLIRPEKISEEIEQESHDQVEEKSDTSEHNDMDVDDDTGNISEKDEAHNTLNALKHLSHLITVKSVNQPKSPVPKMKRDSYFDEYIDNVKDNISDKSSIYPDTSNEKSIDMTIKNKYIQTTTKATTKPLSENTQSDFDESDHEFNDYDETNSDSEFEKLDEIKFPNNDIKRVKLKIRNLPITQNKQMNNDNKVTYNEKEPDDELPIEASSCKKPASSTNLDILKRLTNVTAKCIPSMKGTSQASNAKIIRPIINQIKELSKDTSKVEIFNIDDSDSDNEENYEDTEPNQGLNPLQNLNKNIIKSNQQSVNTNQGNNNKVVNMNTPRSEVIKEQHFKLSKHSPDIQKSINLQNKLKSLGNNITVTSNNSSDTTNKEDFNNFDEFQDEHEHDDGSENNTSKIKITELNEDDFSDSECPDRTDAIVESPHTSNSGHEDNPMDTDDEFADFEKQIKCAKVKKQEATTPQAASSLENLKKINKNLIIKSLSAKKLESEDESSFSSEKQSAEETQNKQISIKEIRPNLPQGNRPVNKPNQNTASLNQSINKNVSTSSNQVVKTVKKFQSQTVIEEITTTVTKTIRTVNQSSNEVVQNSSAPARPRAIRPQRIINRAQGAVIRPSLAVGARVRNVAPIRHPAPAAVKPCNQLVPVRGVVNIHINPTASTSSVRKITPAKTNPINPMIGKLKISPQALSQATKRTKEETVGHFSCFKRPKDSPTSTDTESLDDATVQYATTSQTQSNFTSVTKSVKSKGGVVSATQMRSELSTRSQQQLSKLNNMSGLKVVKMNCKQALQVEEKTVTNTAKKNTLDALEKLQKHGLLVKKPRLEDYNEKSQSESDEEPS